MTPSAVLAEFASWKLSKSAAVGPEIETRKLEFDCRDDTSLARQDSRVADCRIRWPPLSGDFQLEAPVIFVGLYLTAIRV